MTKTCRTTLLICIVLMLTACAQAAKKDVVDEASIMERFRESTPAYTEKQAQAYVKEVLPLVEEVTGRKFKTPPTVKLVRRADLYPVLRKELTPRIKRIFNTLNDEQVRSCAESTAWVYSMCLLGKYGTTTKKLYLLPRNLNPLMNITGANPEYRQQIVKLMISHELAHALQDQEMDIDKVENRAKSVENEIAMSATIEGFGVYVQDAVADKLKIGAAAKEFARLIAIGSIKGMDPADEVLAQQNAGAVADVYLRGGDFIAWQFDKGGIEQVWRVLANPPTSTSMIYHPETYSSVEQATFDYGKVLKGLEQLLVKRKWIVTTQTVGELELRSAWTGMNAKDLDTTLKSRKTSYRSLCTSGDAMLYIDLMILNDKSVAPLIMSATEDVVHANLAKMSASKKYKFTPCAPADFTALKGKADIARRFSMAISVENRSYPISYFDIARGNAIVRVYSGGVTIPDGRLVSMFDELWKRLPAEDK